MPTPITHTIDFTEPLHLKSGGVLSTYKVTHETYGKLNKKRNNAILICHALSGDHHAAGYYPNDNTPGWWHQLIGPKKPIDTERFFVVCSNNIGGCAGSTGPSSINPETQSPYGASFPLISVQDWVNTQAKLSDYLKIQKWAAIIGGSLGGMQALQWSLSYPERLSHAIIIASAAKLSAQNIGFNEIARQAIKTDPHFHYGGYYQYNTAPEEGLSIARMLGHMTYLSTDLMAKKFGRNRQNRSKNNDNIEPEFQIESYLRHQGNRFKTHFDANSYLLMTKALDHFNPAADYEDNLSVALSKATADFLVISFSSDWRFTPKQSQEIVSALQNNYANVSYAQIISDYGHDSFLLDIADYSATIQAYLNSVWEEIQS